MDIHLGRGQANPGRVVHGFEHVVDQPAQGGIHRRHWLGDGTQTRVGELNNGQLGHGNQAGFGPAAGVTRAL